MTVGELRETLQGFDPGARVFVVAPGGESVGGFVLGDWASASVRGVRVGGGLASALGAESAVVVESARREFK